MKGYNYEIKAIPTMFQGVMMRSRLEARWAAFFTECGFPWTYEPIDFGEWSPDFSLNFPHRKIYVEVKPSINDDTKKEMVRVSRCVPKDARTLLVGDSIEYYRHDTVLGVGVDCEEGQCMAVAELDDAIIGSCRAGCGVGISFSYGLWCCWVCGHYEKPPWKDDENLKRKWAEACNKTQWKP